MNDMKFTTAGDYMKDVDMIQEPTDEVMVEKLVLLQCIRVIWFLSLKITNTKQLKSRG